MFFFMWKSNREKHRYTHGSYTLQKKMKVIFMQISQFKSLHPILKIETLNTDVKAENWGIFDIQKLKQKLWFVI